MTQQIYKTTSKTIMFSGFQWVVSNADQPASPGPNFWNSENVWVDNDGRLHLKIRKNISTGLWSCAELLMTQKPGFGKYEFFIEGEIDRLDKNVILGLFKYSGIEGHDEIDIEFSDWGGEKKENLQYSVWPKEGVNAKSWTSDKYFNMQGTYTTHRIIHRADVVKFQGLHGFAEDDQYEFHSAVCSRKRIISEKAMPVYINLWLFKGRAPSDGKEVEVIIHKFSFIPES